MKTVRKIFLIGCAFFLALICIALGYYFFVTRNTRLDPQKLLFNEKNITVYNEQNERVEHQLFPTEKETVRIALLPDHTKYAFIDTEDRRFFSHSGFDFRRIVGAALNNLKAGAFKQGASTISQQLIKNTHLSQEKTVKRKLKEFKLTRLLEKKYSKAEILEKYLNTIYFGHNCFGIQAAAKFYFGKSPQELSLADSAILAGLVKSPNNYSPFKNPENCKRRMTSVLNAMLKNKHLSKAEMEAALNAPLPTPSAQNTQNVGYMNFVFDELASLSDEYGFTVGGNVEIFTYLNEDLQSKTQKILDTETDCGKLALVLDNETLGFKACSATVGNIRRLPGSLIKPLLVYTPAFEKDILSPATPILDEKVNYGGYAPENYDGKYHGYVSARESVEKSLNIPAVKTLETLGVATGASYMKKLGLEIDKEDLSLALALGGMKNGFTLKDMLSAYATLPNGGVYEQGRFISEIRINGVRVYKRERKKRQVFSEESAYLMTDVLQSTAKTGTAKKLRSLPFDIAAKTGTVGTSNGNTDAYAVSYTTKDSVAVWLGNPDNRYIEHTGGSLPCNLLLQINEYLYESYTKKDVPIPHFAAPKNVSFIDLDKTVYYDTHSLVLADKNAPAETTLRELFKNSAIPLKQSDSFSNPHMDSPTISLQKDGVYIQFPKTASKYYEYKIIRSDYATHNTLYFGENPKTFKDDSLKTETTYVYEIVPYYKGIAGEKITLPAVTTKEPILNEKEQTIIEKEWWGY